MEEKETKVTSLRNNEYYAMQETFDFLYKRSCKKHQITDLIKYIITDNNIRLAYRNIKVNKGSKTRGVSGRNITYIKRMKEKLFIYKIKGEIKNYKPRKIRRVGIPKSNGKIRYLGIKEPIDKIIEQAIYQVLDPIATAKFHNNSNGYILGRSAGRAIAQMQNYIYKEKLYYVVDIDIKGFFDNINHAKLLKQLWALGIRDKNLIAIISKMLKAEILNVGIPEKGTPQGGILSPLLANVVLNELDWWLDKKKAKGIRFVRYADDFKLLCPSYGVAKDMLSKTKKWLNERLNLEVSEEKTKIINLKKNYSDFLGIRIKVREKRNKYVIKSVISEKSKTKIKEKVKKQIKDIRYAKNTKAKVNAIELYNLMVRGIQNYYNMATNVTRDLGHIGYIIENYIKRKITKKVYNRDSKLESKMAKDIEKHAQSGIIFIIKDKYLLPLGGTTHESAKCGSNKNYYSEVSRACFHKEVQLDNEYVLDYILKNPYLEESVEFNDNVISKFYGQKGKYLITKDYILNISELKPIKKIDNKFYDKYDNILLVKNKVAKLIKTTENDWIEITKLKRGLNLEQIKNINMIRKENNLPAI